MIKQVGDYMMVTFLRIGYLLILKEKDKLIIFNRKFYGSLYFMKAKLAE